MPCTYLQGRGGYWECWLTDLVCWCETKFVVLILNVSLPHFGGEFRHPQQSLPNFGELSATWILGLCRWRLTNSWKIGFGLLIMPHPHLGWGGPTYHGWKTQFGIWQFCLDNPSDNPNLGQNICNLESMLENIRRQFLDLVLVIIPFRKNNNNVPGRKDHVSKEQAENLLKAQREKFTLLDDHNLVFQGNKIGVVCEV